MQLVELRPSLKSIFYEKPASFEHSIAACRDRIFELVDTASNAQSKNGFNLTWKSQKLKITTQQLYYQRNIFEMFKLNVKPIVLFMPLITIN